ncbi:MAG: bifunctional demethylmenaquinone methyltransferase/2-methoxy-6-polyprenyl-1,4-benzoquinol methylase UbiE [Rhizobiaceae bacterium]|jgi:demethylmenaquinone methyltransferase/2-methoxy-6-polyprenyl-1,4-benzoquinol methylase|nr:bifunctional demethylmenaquinone methyltransferase/2-methoxy-6-polyprenyl-1,4-benzoquinol methylase UbiE [Rhizobiaceae bacterium]
MPTDRAARPEEMTQSFGFESVGDGTEKQEKVNAVFHSVARRYDMMNDLMSGGLHRAWKDAMVSALAPAKTRPFHVLDVAGGTGDIAFRILHASPSAEATVLDINGSMLEVGRDRAVKAKLDTRCDFVEANAEELPFPDRSFDAYTIAFGIRNVPDIPKALREARRVLKTGGRFLCLEFSEVTQPILDRVYDAWSFNAIPRIGKAVTGDAESYQYLVESIRKFPRQDVFAGLIRDAGFSRVSWRNYTGGIAALHSGWAF